jgi:hypothetical protein
MASQNNQGQLNQQGNKPGQGGQGQDKPGQSSRLRSPIRAASKIRTSLNDVSQNSARFGAPLLFAWPFSSPFAMSDWMSAIGVEADVAIQGSEARL